MVEKKKYKIFAAFVFVVFILFAFYVSGLSLAGQFDSDPFGSTAGASAEPVINAAVDYENGLILFKFNVDANQHITDIKYGFFKIEAAANNFIEIAETVFPEGIPYANEKVFKGNFEVKVYVKNKEKMDQPVPVKFTVSYQVCKERPIEMCFAPTSQQLEITLARSFGEFSLAKTAPAEQPKTGGSGEVKIEPPAGKSIHPLLLLLVGIFLAAVAVFAGLFESWEETEARIKLFKVCLALLCLGGSFLYVKSLDIVTGGSGYSAKEKPVNPVTLDWLHDLEEGQQLAREKNKMLMIDTSAEWCVACKELDEYTFSHPEVAGALKDYIPVKLDFTQNNETNKKLGQQLKIFGMPTVIFLDSQGQEIRRFSGFYDKRRFLEFIGSGTSFFEKLLAPLNRELEKRSLLLFVLVFGLGFLTSLTPCVYPVIPLVMGYIGTRSGKKKLKGFYLSIFFVLGLALVYSILGVIAGTSGTMMGASFQNPVVVIVIAAVFILMGLSLAGLFEIPVPASISSKIQSGHKSEIIGSLVVGGISGIIAAPCVGPVLIALLSWISQTRDIVFGFLLTFTFSLGMGMIFLAVGTFSGILTALPKGGKWMNIVKYFFAAILTAGGIFILNPIIPAWLSMLIWGIFLAGLAIFMGLLTPLEEAKFKNRLYKLVVFLIFVAGIFFFMKSLDTRFFSTNRQPAGVVETGWLNNTKS